MKSVAVACHYTIKTLGITPCNKAALASKLSPSSTSIQAFLAFQIWQRTPASISRPNCTELLSQRVKMCSIVSRCFRQIGQSGSGISPFNRTRSSSDHRFPSSLHRVALSSSFGIVGSDVKLTTLCRSDYGTCHELQIDPHFSEIDNDVLL
ncbi:hypothetical protein NL676_036385 [Syzygium grande]|nr:hypothetical protein NL676_036385 [Syzygium grande]